MKRLKGNKSSFQELVRVLKRDVRGALESVYIVILPLKIG